MTEDTMIKRIAALIDRESGFGAKISRQMAKETISDVRKVGLVVIDPEGESDNAALKVAMMTYYDEECRSSGDPTTIVRGSILWQAIRAYLRAIRDHKGS